MTIPMERYAYIAMYMLAMHIGVHMVPVKCGKYSLKRMKFWAKTSNFPCITILLWPVVYS